MLRVQLQLPGSRLQAHPASRLPRRGSRVAAACNNIRLSSCRAGRSLRGGEPVKELSVCSSSCAGSRVRRGFECFLVVLTEGRRGVGLVCGAGRGGHHGDSGGDADSEGDGVGGRGRSEEETSDSSGRGGGRHSRPKRRGDADVPQGGGRAQKYGRGGGRAGSGAGMRGGARGVEGRGGGTGRREDMRGDDARRGADQGRHPGGRGAHGAGVVRGRGQGVYRVGVEHNWSGRAAGDVHPDRLAGMSGRELEDLLLDLSRSAGAGDAVPWQKVMAYIAQGGPSTLRGCRPTGLARMANAVVKLNGPYPAEGEVLAGVVVIDQAAVALVMDGRFPHQNCSMLAYNFAKLGYYSALWFPHLAKVAGVRHWGGIDPQSISNMVYAYATAGHRDEQSQALVDDMIVAALPQLQNFNPQDTANMVWALAKLGHPLDRPQLLERAAAALPDSVGKLDASSLLHLLLERGAMHQLGNSTTQALANLLWGWGQLQEQHGEGLEVDGAHVGALVGAMVRVAGKCQSQSISNTFLAVVALGHPMQQKEVDTLVRALLDQRGRMDAQAIANTIWACATAGYMVQEQQLQQLVKALADMVLQTPGRLLPQAASNTLWGCATMSCSVSPEDCGALVGWLVQNISSCKPQEVSNTLWACATMGCSVSPEHHGALVGWLVQNISSCNPQAIANSVWALSRLQPASGSTQQQLQPSTVQLLEALPAFVEANRAGFKPQEISNTALAAATLECHVPGLMAVLVSAARPQLQCFSPQNLANLLWALAVLEPMESQQVFRELEGTVAGMLGGFNEQAVGNTAWAYAVVLGQQVDRQLATALLQRVQGELTQEGKCQLYSLVMLMPAEVAASLQPEVQRLVGDCRAAYISVAQVSAASRVQHDVYQVLRSMKGGLQLEMEHVAEGGLFCIDIALNPKAGPGQRVAVEVDGPTHYTSSKPHLELGHTVLRRRLLERYGWRVVSVPVREWDVQRDKAAYLRGLLASAAVL